MQKRKAAFAAALVMSFFISSSFNSVSAWAATNSSSSKVLKEKMEGSDVTSLQQNLKQLGLFNGNPTGYYGDITETAVKILQERYGITKDGIAGPVTLALIGKLSGSANVAAARKSSVLKKGAQGSEATALQKDLQQLGFLGVNPTGYYGDLTVAAVKSLQGRNGLTKDGIAGNVTFTLIDKLMGRSGSAAAAASTLASRGSVDRTNYLLPWFGEVNKIFERGSTATIYDINSGLSFKVKRSYGTNHADCEPLTADDTKTMKKIYGGQWSWNRRAVIVTVDGKKIAASMAGMPHAGVESKKAGTYVTGRSGSFGSGTNFDNVKGNSMSGHFDLHFLGSKTHGSNKVDSAHQAMVKKAAQWAKENY